MLSLSDGDILATRGFYSVGDGGAAYYDVLSSDSLTDNGLDIISLNDKYATLRIVDNTVNVRQLGAKGDNVTDDSAVLNRASALADTLYIPNGTFRLNPVYASNLDSKVLNGPGFIQFTSWSQEWSIDRLCNVYTGLCKVEYLSNPIYKDCHWPGEAKYPDDTRVNTCVSTVFKLDDVRRGVNVMGSIKRVTEELPDEFTLCIGPAKVLAYKDGQWNMIVSRQYLGGALHTSDWSSQVGTKIDDCKTVYDDHIEYKLTKDLWFMNGKEHTLHFYSQNHVIPESDRGEDYEYIMVYTTVWVKDKEHEGLFGSRSGCDLRDTVDVSRAYELGVSRNITLTTKPRAIYMCNVPDDKFEELVINKMGELNAIFTRTDLILD